MVSAGGPEHVEAHGDEHIEAGSLLGRSLVFLVPSCRWQEWSVDPGVCRLVGADSHIKDSWFWSIWLGLWLTERVHLALLYTPGLRPKAPILEGRGGHM